MLVEPGQQCEGDGDLGAEIGPGGRGLVSGSGSSAGAAQQEPVREEPNQPGVFGRFVGEGLV